MRLKGFLKAATLGSVFPVITLVSCFNNNHKVLLSQDNKIVLASAIPNTWPQYNSINNIVNDYNENYKDNKFFMPVVFMSQEDTKTKGYSDLSSKVNKLIASKSSNVPNLLVGNFQETYELSSLDKLLNLESSKVNRSLFDEKFIKNRTSLMRENYKNGLWALPLNVTTNSSLVFNKPVMKKIIMLMKDKGMIINADQKNNPFLYEIMQSKSDKNYLDSHFNDDIKKKFQYHKPSELWKDKTNNTENKSLNSYSISDQTFKTYDKVYEFAIKAKKSLELDQSLYIFGSYFVNDFLSILDSKTGLSKTNFPLFALEGNCKSFTFPFLIDNSDAQKKVKDAFNKIYQLIKNKAVYKPENTNIVGLRNGQFAFSTMPSVSSRYSYQSTTFGDYTNNGFAFDDFIYLPQLSKYNSTDKNGSYSLAESMLMGIKTNESKNQAAKAFIDFLYTGKMKNNKKVTDYLAETSGYVVPLKNNTSEDAIKKYEEKFQENKKNNKLDKAAIYRAIKNTFESINNGSYRPLEGDQYTSKLISIIKNIFDGIVKEGKNWDDGKFIAEIKKHQNEFKVK